MNFDRWKRIAGAFALVSVGIMITPNSVDVVSATPTRHTITVSGNCHGQSATSDWETVTGRVPTSPANIVAFKPGDTVRIVNNCDTNVAQSYAGELFLQNQPAAWNNPTIPDLTGTPTFSDSAVWNVAPTSSDWSYGTINRGRHVDLVLAASTGRWVFAEMLAPWLAGSNVFGSGAWYGSYVVGSLAIERGGSPVTQVFASQAAAMTPVNVAFTGYGSRSRIAVDNLPAGLSVTSSCVVADVFCTSPATIGGTPTQDGVYTVTFRGRDDQMAWDDVGFSQTLQIVVGPAISPATQTISGTSGSAITASTPFTANSFTGAVTYAVTSGSLPNGLTLNASTGVISGTPTVASSATITITATGATAGTATATITFAIVAGATTSTVATPTTLAPSSNAAGPTLVTSANQAALTAAPGKASALVNGVAVSPQIVTASNSTAAQTDPAERTPEQVRELQQTATTIETRLDTIAGGDSGVSVVRTETGAVLTGIFTGTRVPVEDVVVVNAADTATLFAARDVRGNIVEVKPGAVLEVASNGDVAVQAFGLRTGETVELVVMSTPTLLGTFTVDAKGSIKTTAKLPNTIGSGNHSLVVASPTVKASLGLKMVKSSAALPVTGTADDLGNWAVAVLLSGVYIMMVSRSRRRIL
jgi:hypothetical protein